MEWWLFCDDECFGYCGGVKVVLEVVRVWFLLGEVDWVVEVYVDLSQWTAFEIVGEGGIFVGFFPILSLLCFFFSIYIQYNLWINDGWTHGDFLSLYSNTNIILENC